MFDKNLRFAYFFICIEIEICTLLYLNKKELYLAVLYFIVKQNILLFWLDKGVDGFHVRNVQYLYEDQNLGDEILIPGKTGKVCHISYFILKNFIDIKICMFSIPSIGI